MKLILFLTIALVISGFAQKQEQVITFQPIKKKVAYGDEYPYMVATSSSELPVTLVSSNEDVAFVQRNYLVLLAPGKTIITATQEGDDRFLPAKAVRQEVIVRPFLESQTAGYKNSPSEPSRRYYDWHVMPIDQWIAKYYKKPDLFQWNAWQKHASTALNDPAKFKAEWGERSKFFNYDLMKSTYDSLSKSKSFDDDINLYISFLAGDGFFKHYKISVQHWFTMHNWRKPYDRPVKSTLLIREILKIPYGPNYLRVIMAQMEWWET